ncbi:MAG: pentapeptide repeat-containing protein [Nostoc sp.]|uniref:pentapeptide repeat-containing protein n=1 Tax=Nostoc sp. TaxID=1180 RepID=UPI002FFC2B93
MDKSAEAANKTAEAALKNAENALKNAQAAQDKQITERFAKAIEQLGNEKIETRLGAIYTLERIAKDSKDDHWTIMEVLTAFVRENAPVKKDQKQESPKIRTDIQAALTVIGRRNSKNEHENQRLDLSNIDITGVDLIKANLERADFISSNLEGALLREARLQNAEFYDANLRSAVLSEANLQKAYLSGTKLQQANLYKANLQGSFLPGANLHLANLAEANLQGTNLSGAKNLEQHQIELAKGDRTTILPENLQPLEHWKTKVSPFKLQR